MKTSIKEGFKVPDKDNINKVEVSTYMMDRKAAVVYLDIAGAYCDFCSVNKKDCHNVEIINIEALPNISTSHQI